MSSFVKFVHDCTGFVGKKCLFDDHNLSRELLKDKCNTIQFNHIFICITRKLLVVGQTRVNSGIW